MSALTDAIESGDMAEILAIVDRVANLPGFGATDQVSKIRHLATAVEKYERIAREKREALRKSAGELIRKVVEMWPAEEIEAATGYKP